ncbi:stage III sporulation protein AF [Anaeroselena agilis]|uniref:Stage III sporulation protein AF n=1 Tax=Anaeroselena agilis TaxID=3063788 RepID=A0ABU3NW59_9FIRM|nr:stage III sporulation protein AF [Selenomonadales bacterium 4137-cl]
MLSALTDWVRNIIMVVLFATFLELLLPSSGMQRFVRVIMGMLILLAILGPAVDILQSRITPEMPAFAGQSDPAADRVTSGAEAVVRARDRLAAEYYRKDLARQIRAVVAGIDGVADARVAVELEQGEGGRAGALGKVRIFVSPGLTSADRKVAKITVGKEDGAHMGELRPALRERIVRTVSELYQLPVSHIDVTKMN